MRENTSLTPFGLRDATPPLTTSAAGPISMFRHGVRTENSGFTGRPLGEETDDGDEGDDPPSAPTETDGKDPLAVDSDPFYD